MSFPRCFTTRSRLASRAGVWLVLLLLSCGSVATAQPARGDSTYREQAAPASSIGTWVLVLLVGVGLGVLGAKLLGGKKSGAAPPPVLTPEPMQRQPAQNRPRENQGKTPVLPQKARTYRNKERPQEAPEERAIRKEMEQEWKEKHKDPARSNQPRANADNRQKNSGKANAPGPPKFKTPPMQTNQNAGGDGQSLSLGQTVDLSPKPSIEELIDATATPAASAPAVSSAPAAGGPLHYYAPAPDVPSIEHRKFSPNPLPQMPLLVTLAHAEAEKAEYSFSPQADQSRIIGNGVRELKEFFAFELPPTEQFTSIRNVKPGKLEKREDTWHVLQKAEIALS